MARYIDVDKVTYNKIKESSLADDLTERELTTIIQVFRNLPTEDVTPIVRGKWIEDKETISPYYCFCSNCHKRILLGEYKNFCPNCGAKMEE